MVIYKYSANILIISVIALFLFTFTYLVRGSGFFTSISFAQEKLSGQNKEIEPQYIEGEIIVEVNSLKTASFNESTLEVFDTDLKIESRLGRRDTYLLQVGEEEDVLEVVKELSKSKEFTHVQPNFKYELHAIQSNDPDRGVLWGLDNTGQTVNGDPGTADADIDAPEAWSQLGITATGEWAGAGLTDVIVGILDTGIAYNHPDFSGVLWDGSSCVDETSTTIPGGCTHGYDFQEDDTDPISTGWDHGSHVAGTVAAVADNSTGILGVAPNAKIMALKVDTPDGFVSTSAAIDAIAFAEANNATVLNASWGGGASSCLGAYDALLYSAIDDFSGVFVTSAGNNAREHDLSSYFGFPADYGSDTSCWTGLDNIVTVAASDNDDELASFSDYGAAVNIAAPGRIVYSATIDSDLIEFEDFETIADGELPLSWTTNAGDPGVKDIGGAFSETLFGDEDSPYTVSSTNIFTTESYSISSYDSAIMDFWAACDTEYPGGDDFMSLSFSSNGTDFGDTVAWYESVLDSSDGGAGYSTAHLIFNLDDAYLTDNFTARYNWSSDASLNFEGCGIDDFTLEGFNDRSTANVYTYKNGTSMAAPHVAGALALILGASPAIDPVQVLNSYLLPYADTPSGLSGQVDGDRRLNVYNSIVPTLDLNKEYFAFNDTVSSGQKTWAVVSNIPTNPSDLITSLAIGTSYTEGFVIPPGTALTAKREGYKDGPVVIYTDGTPITSQRTALYGGSGLHSFNEYPGVKEAELGTEFYFSFYDTLSPGQRSWIVVANPSSTATANVTIDIGSSFSDSFTIAPSSVMTLKEESIKDGPVVVSSDINVLATQRTTVYDSFSEYPGIPSSELGTTFYFSFNDTVSAGQKSWTVVSNPSSSTTANVTIDIGTSYSDTFEILPNSALTLKVEDIKDGPVVVTSDINVLATQRTYIEHSGGKKSFNEYPGIPAAELGTEFYFSFYDTLSAGQKAWTMVSNPSNTTTANVNVLIGATDLGSFEINPNSFLSLKVEGIKEGPVVVTSDINVLATQRTSVYTSFNEYPGIIYSP